MAVFANFQIIFLKYLTFQYFPGGTRNMEHRSALVGSESTSKRFPKLWTAAKVKTRLLKVKIVVYPPNFVILQISYPH